MRIIEKKKFVVEGYQFETESQAKQALKEAEGVRYTKENLNMADPEEVLKVYNRILQEKVFSTPVGYYFLKDLQEFLNASPVIRRKDIHPIDFQPVIEKAKESDKEALAIKKKANREKYKEDERRRRKRAKEKRSEQSNGKNYRVQFINSLIINIILVMMVVAMFVIMKLSDVPTIIDYENKIIDKYENWEKELNERENRIEEYEIKYNIKDED